MLMAAWKLAPALATGNTTVLKPAETTPLTALLLAEVIQQAELPPGVVNVRHGGGGDRRRARRRRRRQGRVHGLDRGRQGRSAARSAGTGKRLTLELGGKAANIVFEDAPLDQAVEGVVNGIFFNQGHVCCAGSRLLVQEPIFEPLLEKLKARLRDAPGRRPARQEHRHRCDQLAGAALEDRGARRRRASRRAPRCTSPTATFPSAGSGSVRRCSPASASRTGSRARRSSARCCRSSRSARRRRPSRRRTTPRTASRPGCGPRRARGSSGWPSAWRPGSCGRTRSTGSIPSSPFGGYKESGFGREGGLHGLEPYVELTARNGAS